MLPQSHIGYTLLAYKVTQKLLPVAPNVDYRLLAVAALTPDLLDKPLVLATYRHWHATKLVAHTGLWHLLLLVLIRWRKPGWWPYALAANGHLLVDALWQQPRTLCWPGRGWHFQRDRHRPWRKKTLADYWRDLLSWPRGQLLEAGGGLALLLFIWLGRLFRPARFWHFLRTGRS